MNFRDVQVPNTPLSDRSWPGTTLRLSLLNVSFSRNGNQYQGYNRWEFPMMYVKLIFFYT